MFKALKAMGKALFSSPPTIDDVFDKDNGHLAKVGGFIGKMVFTDQEKAELNKEVMGAYSQFVTDTLGENTERSKSRRELAKFIILFWFLLLFMAVMVWPWYSDWSDFILQVAFNTALVVLVNGVGAFLYGTHMLRAAKGKEASGR